jgi:hypothetical protein
VTLRRKDPKMPIYIDDLIARLERSKDQAAHGEGRSADEILAEARARLAKRRQQPGASID